MRLANAEILPFDPDSFAQAMNRATESIRERAMELRAEAEEHNRRVAEGSLELTANPYLPYQKPVPVDTVPEFDFTPLTAAVERLQKVSEQYGRRVRQIIAGNRIDSALPSRLNRILMELEPSLLTAEGLPNRPWYRHQIWAPGINTGYSGFAFPGIHESLVSRDWKTAEQQIPVIASALNRFSDLVEQAIQASK